MPLVEIWLKSIIRSIALMVIVFFLLLRASGIIAFLQSDRLQQRAEFYDILTAVGNPTKKNCSLFNAYVFEVL